MIFGVRANLKKISLVVFITVLIWVWADLATDDTQPGVPGTLWVDPAANPDLWVSFDGESSAQIKMTLSGPASRIAEVARRLKDRSLKFEFYFDAAKEKMDASEPMHTLDVPAFLQRNKDIKKLGLKVTSCEPDKINVQVQKLVRRTLPVECLDESLSAIREVESVNPPSVEMRVPDSWAGEQLKAFVQLRPKQIEQARVAAISLKPYVPMARGKLRYAEASVEVKLSPTKDSLQSYLIPSATIGFVFSAKLQGRYEVGIDNESEVFSTIKIKATPEAKSAYEGTAFKMLLDIRDGDEKAAELISREPIYNFPPEYVRRDEIQLDGQPVTVRFKLIPTAVAAAPAPAG